MMEFWKGLEWALFSKVQKPHSEMMENPTKILSLKIFRTRRAFNNVVFFTYDPVL